MTFAPPPDDRASLLRRAKGRILVKLMRDSGGVPPTPEQFKSAVAAWTAEHLPSPYETIKQDVATVEPRNAINEAAEFLQRARKALAATSPEALSAWYSKASTADAPEANEQRQKRLEASLREFFKRQHAAVIAAVREHAEHVVAKPKDTSVWWSKKWDAELEAILKPYEQKLAAETYAKVAAELGGKGLLARKATLTEVLPELTSGLGKRITGINETTRESVYKQIEQGIRYGEGPSTIADRLEDAGIFGEYRSELVARTETMHALNDASIGSYAEYGVTQVEAVDGDEDEECAARNGQVFSLEDAMAIEDHPNGTLSWSPVISTATMPETPTPTTTETSLGIVDQQSFVDATRTDPNHLQLSGGQFSQQTLESNNFAAQWAHSTLSDDAVALQEAARIRWGGTLSEAHAARVAELKKLPGWSDRLASASAHLERSQAALAGPDINVTVYRGVSRLPRTVDGHAEINPLSSWTSDVAQAQRYAGSDGYVLEAEVPLSRVAGVSQSGIGHRLYSEVVLKGGRIDYNVVRGPAKVAEQVVQKEVKTFEEWLEGIGAKVDAVKNDPLLERVMREQYENAVLRPRLAEPYQKMSRSEIESLLRKPGAREEFDNILKYRYDDPIELQNLAKANFTPAHERALIDALENARATGGHWNLRAVRFEQRTASELGQKGAGAWYSPGTQTLHVPIESASYRTKYLYKEYEGAFANHIDDFDDILTHEIGHAIHFRSQAALDEWKKLVEAKKFDRTLVKQLKNAKEYTRQYDDTLERFEANLIEARRVGDRVEIARWEDKITNVTKVRDAYVRQVEALEEARKAAKSAEAFETALTKYARKTHYEDFAETFWYYVHNPDALKRRSPTRYRVMKRILETMT